jgi:Arc/MetJ-type ribon-helix-helix transcriptional regulator
VRINARLDEEDAEKLASVAKSEGKSVSEVVRAAIQSYYEQARAARAAATGLLERNGFVGCASGESNLSTTYKERLGDGLRKKHGHR